MILKSICMGIDKDKVIEGIDKYYELTGEYPHYMIMNRESEYLLKDFQFLMRYTNTETTGFSSFHGIPVAICNKLETGVVDFV